MDPLSILVIGLFAAAVVLVPVAAVLQRRKAPPKPEAPQPAPEEEAPRCPCGRPATHSLPQFRVVEWSIIGRRVRRERDPFGPIVACKAHSDVGGTIIDEHLARAALHDAQAERAKLTALANDTADTLGAVAAALPEARKKAWDARVRALKPPPAVRVLRAANDDSGGEGG